MIKKITVYTVTCGEESINFPTRSRANHAMKILGMFNIPASLETVKQNVNININKGD